jgi:SOS-response transcriptional repressor LexA
MSIKGNMYMTVGDRLKEARQSLGLKQTEIANILGINSNFLSNIERGAKSPSKKLIETLSSAYKINANWLLTGEGDMFVGGTSIKEDPLIKEFEDRIHKLIKKDILDIETRLSALERRFGNIDPAEGSFTGEYPPDYLDYVAEPVSFSLAEPESEYGGSEAVPERIPYVEDIAAGPPIPQSEAAGLFARVPREYIRGGKSEYYAAGIRGESMSAAGIPDGSAVLIRRADAPRDGAIQVVAWEGRSTLKRLREKEGGGWELHYEDGTNRVITVGSGEYRVQGDFVAVLPPECRIG